MHGANMKIVKLLIVVVNLIRYNKIESTHICHYFQVRYDKMDIYTENVIGKCSSWANICDSDLSDTTTVWLKISSRISNCLYIKRGKLIVIQLP